MLSHTFYQYADAENAWIPWDPNGTPAYTGVMGALFAKRCETLRNTGFGTEKM
jgi:hypothetical protein